MSAMRAAIAAWLAIVQCLLWAVPDAAVVPIVQNAATDLMAAVSPFAALCIKRTKRSHPPHRAGFEV